MKQLSLDEIKVGMMVNPRQLDDILYTYVILANKSDITGESEIIYIGEEDVDKFQSFRYSYPSLCVVYNTDDLDE